MNIKEEIYQTADLLAIAITDEEAEKLTQSFSQLMEYFSVLQDTPISDGITQSVVNKGVLRNASVCQYDNPHELVERSEEHEDNFFIIPSVL